MINLIWNEATLLMTANNISSFNKAMDKDDMHNIIKENELD